MDDGHLYKPTPRPHRDASGQEVQTHQPGAGVRPADTTQEPANHNEPEGPDHHHDHAQIPAIDYDPYDYTASLVNHVLNHVYDHHQHGDHDDLIDHEHPAPDDPAAYYFGTTIQHNIDYALHHSAVYHNDDRSPDPDAPDVDTYDEHVTAIHATYCPEHST